MDPKALQRIERSNYLLGAILIALVAALGTGAQTLGAAIGAVLSAVNFSAIRRVVGRIVAAKPEDKGRPAVALIGKMAILMVAIGLAIYFLPLSPVMLAVGFSIFLISIAIETVRFVSGQRGGADGAGGTSHG